MSAVTDRHPLERGAWDALVDQLRLPDGTSPAACDGLMGQFEGAS